MDTPSAQRVLEQAFAEHADAIFRHCSFRLNDRELARDVTQDVFERTWDYLARGNEIGHMKSFLYTVAHNLIINARAKRRSVSLEQAIEDDPSREPAHDPRTATTARLELAQALERLRADNPAYADALILRYIDDLPVKDIAKILGESENALSVRIHRAREALKRIIDPSYE